MRTHSYRGFSKKLNKWVFGNLISDLLPFIVGEVVESCEEYISLEFWEPVEPKSVGQLTGLTDKNGVDIFEGDIVRVTDDDDGDVVAKIEWCDSGMWCAGERNEYGFDFVPSLGNLTLSDYHKVEVIGNVFSNPELLKEGAE